MIDAARLRSALEMPVSASWLGAFRALFGLTMAISMLRFLAYGWIDSFFVEPSFHFKYWGFAWVTPLPGPLMHALFWALAAAALAFALGVYARFCGLLFTLGFAYLSLIDVTIYLNHYYLALWLSVLLVLSPAPRVLALDALWRLREVRTLPRFWLALFRFQVGAVYTFAGLAKLHGDWLIHAQPLRIWLGSSTDLPLLGSLLALPGAALAMSWAGFLFDTSIAWFLLYRPTRPYAYGAVLVFHAITRALFPIGMFPVIMVLSAALFFEPDWPERVISRLGVKRVPSLAPRFHLGWPLLAASALFCALSLLMPLRFLAYGGNVRWHEQGMRWSWRVMVREKNGSVTFLVHEKDSGRDLEVSPHRYLTRLQEREMAGQPDLILQLAHHIRDDFGRRGRGPVEVRADALVSLNGRHMARLIDPDVDLTGVEDGLLPAAWILPAPDEAPPALRPLGSALSLTAPE
jgi:vitamin K-dependent gamma-carboxylase